MLGDFDADGDLDVLSGSYPGELYLFQRNADGSFADGKTLKDRDGNAIKADKASTVFLADWDADGDLDLVLGSIRGDVYLVINEGAAKAPEFGKPVKDLDLAGSNSGPIVADWDGDGLADLLVGLSDGSAHWLRNVGTAEKPEFASSETLVEKSGFGFRFEDRKPGQWGARVKLCATDFNGDGRLDLLLGDRSGDVVEPEMTVEQQKALDKAKQRMAELTKQRAEVSTKMRTLQRASRNGEKPKTDEDRQQAKERARELEELVKSMQQLTTEYGACRQKLSQVGPQKVRHGFVWFFQRKPKVE